MKKQSTTPAQSSKTKSTQEPRPWYKSSKFWAVFLVILTFVAAAGVAVWLLAFYEDDAPEEDQQTTFIIIDKTTNQHAKDS